MVKRMRSTCRVVLIKPPTIVGEGGVYNAFNAPIPVEVCKKGRSATITFNTLDFGTVKVTLSGIKKQADKYRELSRRLPCPGAREAAGALAREWGGFYRSVKSILKGV